MADPMAIDSILNPEPNATGTDPMAIDSILNPEPNATGTDPNATGADPNAAQQIPQFYDPNAAPVTSPRVGPYQPIAAQYSSRYILYMLY